MNTIGFELEYEKHVQILASDLSTRHDKYNITAWWAWEVDTLKLFVQFKNDSTLEQESIPFGGHIDISKACEILKDLVNQKINENDTL